MGLFKKKKGKAERCCCCNSSSNNEGNDKSAYIKVLGSGCKKCKQLEENVIETLKQLGMNKTVGHVTDMAEIASYGVMSTPALVIDEKVVSYGKVLSCEEITELLKK